MNYAGNILAFEVAGIYTTVSFFKADIWPE